MGNRKGDLDSIVGTVCLAYYHFMEENGTKHIEIDESDVYYVPLINLNKSDLSSRLEILYAFEAYDVNTDYFLTLDDVNI